MDLSDNYINGTPMHCTRMETNKVHFWAGCLFYGSPGYGERLHLGWMTCQIWGMTTFLAEVIHLGNYYCNVQLGRGHIAKHPL